MCLGDLRVDRFVKEKFREGREGGRWYRRKSLTRDSSSKDKAMSVVWW
jgi:hypothetical protein